jgi:hypothetical protein
VVVTRAEVDADADGEVGADVALHLLDGEPGRVPRAHGHAHGLPEPGVLEEAPLHALDTGGGQRAVGGDEQAVLLPQHWVVGGGPAPKSSGLVGKEPRAARTASDPELKGAFPWVRSRSKEVGVGTPRPATRRAQWRGSGPWSQRVVGTHGGRKEGWAAARVARM